MPGLFVQYHAELVASFASSSVLYVHPDVTLKKRFETVSHLSGDVFTVEIYYRTNPRMPGIIRKPLSVLRYLRAMIKGYRLIRKERGEVDLVHVHVLTRNGFFAYVLKKVYGIPYVITEHWSRYLPHRNEFTGRFRRWITRRVVASASAVTTVTGNLKNAMNAHGLNNADYRILPNVVDTDLFSIPASRHAGKTRFIHVSCFEDRSKNISGMLEVLKSVAEERNDFECVLIGEGIDFNAMKQKATDLGLTGKLVTFTGLLEGQKLAEQYRKADFLVLFSNYENMPVVINEAFSCGLPVVATDVGGIPEYVNETNGILARPGDHNDMKEKLMFMIDHFSEYNRKTIRDFAVTHFSKKAVTAKLKGLYEDVLTESE